MKIQITRGGSLIDVSPTELERMRCSFRRDHFVSLPDILDRDLLNAFINRLDVEEFGARAAVRENARYVKSFGPLSESVHLAISFVFNDAALFGLVRAITDCPPIESFVGRVIRMVPGQGHFVKWHIDNYELPKRLLALRVNLGRSAYKGGALQFRLPGGEEIVSECADGAVGNAVLFKSFPVEHRNSELVGSVEKTTFAGWFHSFDGARWNPPNG